MGGFLGAAKKLDHRVLLNRILSKHASVANMQDVLLTFAAVSVGLERVAVPAGALVHVVVQVEAELRARDPAVLASP